MSKEFKIFLKEVCEEAGERVSEITKTPDLEPKLYDIFKQRNTFGLTESYKKAVGLVEKASIYWG